MDVICFIVKTFNRLAYELRSSSVSVVSLFCLVCSPLDGAGVGVTLDWFVGFSIDGEGFAVTNYVYNYRISTKLR